MDDIFFKFGIRIDLVIAEISSERVNILCTVLAGNEFASFVDVLSWAPSTKRVH